jgi:hypothetical protein
MEIRVQVKRRHLVIFAMLTATTVAAVAYGAIPNGGGAYTACMVKKTGTIRLIDTSLGSKNRLGHCTAEESPITWGKAAGIPIVAQLVSGDAHCPAGGASITGASGSVAYVCSAQSSNRNLQSPNGQYTLQLTDQGVALKGPGATIKIAAGTLDLSSNDETDEVGANRTETIGAADSLTVGTNRSVTVGGSQTESISADESTAVGQDRSAKIGGSDSTSVVKNESATIAGSQTDDVQGTDALNVHGDRTEQVTGTETTQDGGDFQQQVGGNLSIASAHDGQIKAIGTLHLLGTTVKNN